MARIKVDINLKELNKIMKSEAMEAKLAEVSQAICDQAGEDYSYRVHQADYVAISNIFPTTPAAKHDNYENNTLLKAAGTVACTSKPKMPK